MCQKPVDTTTKVVTITNIALKDCFVNSKYIWILRQDGVIIRINPETHIISDSMVFNKKIVSIGKSKTDTIYAADEDGGIFRIFDNRDTNFLWSTGESVQSFIFSMDKRCFLITDKGIFEPEFSKRLYYENAYSNGFIWRRNLRKWHPSTLLINSKDDIWLGFSGGEWGGDIIIFSTNELRYKKFRDEYKEHCYLRPVRSFLEIDSNMHASTSLQHMSIITSSIIRLNDTCKYIFESPSGEDGSENLFNKEELYIGPSIFNKTDSSIYFYSQFGIFKGNINNNLNKLENWQRKLETKFMWNYGMPDAVGYGMNVSKMFFENNKLFLLSPNNGILIWDGKQSVLLKTTYKPED